MAESAGNTAVEGLLEQALLDVLDDYRWAWQAMIWALRLREGRPQPGRFWRRLAAATAP